MRRRDPPAVAERVLDQRLGPPFGGGAGVWRRSHDVTQGLAPEEHEAEEHVDRPDPLDGWRHDGWVQVLGADQVMQEAPESAAAIGQERVDLVYELVEPSCRPRFVEGGQQGAGRCRQRHRPLTEATLRSGRSVDIEVRHHVRRQLRLVLVVLWFRFPMVNFPRLCLRCGRAIGQKNNKNGTKE